MGVAKSLYGLPSRLISSKRSPASRGRMFMRGVGNKCSLGIIGEFAPIADFAR
jgi:hypothetical protein